MVNVPVRLSLSKPTNWGNARQAILNSKVERTRRMDGFLAFINEHQLFTPTDRVLVAVSGGIDSVVLTHLLHRYGYTIGLAHVNFGLREAESDADAAFVENMARQYGVPYHHTGFDTEAEAKQRGESIQVTARQLRYAWFGQVRTQYAYRYVATAHHLDDVLETVLLNLTRGTGLTGLTGIPICTAEVVRPLWFASREQIEAYAREQGLTWRDDASNATDKYARNRLRHQVVPVLKELNPGLLTHLPHTLTYLRTADAVLNKTMADLWKTLAVIGPNGTQIDINKLRDVPDPQFCLGEWLRPYGFSADALKQFWQSVDQTGISIVRNGQRIESETHRLVHERGSIWLLPRTYVPSRSVLLTELPTDSIELAEGQTLLIETFERAMWDGNLRNQPAVALFDADCLPLPWVLRPWQQGDRLQPLGLNGSQLVSDLLTNAKIPAPVRQRLWVLEAAGQIAWVVGVRMAHPFRVTPTTRRLIRLRFRE
jgi:tRNA(Ile)-lysidine synthase